MAYSHFIIWAESRIEYHKKVNINMNARYPIGITGKAWGNIEKSIWRSKQRIHRSYQNEVLQPLFALHHQVDLVHYGALPYNKVRYPLFLAKSKQHRASLPNVLITGGVHGYETSGVQGALLFIQKHMQAYSQYFNFFIAPCISPWAYETINRWNPYAVDPNRSFFKGSESPEAQAIMQYMRSYEGKVIAHFDLHETTDTDNTEFRPALAAREGSMNHDMAIPDGFYTVSDTSRTNLAFQEAIIAKVKQVTHIAPADENGMLIGSEAVAEGVILYDKSSLHLCGGFTSAKYITTTEVYPDSEQATAEACNQAQVAAIQGGLDYILKHG